MLPYKDSTSYHTRRTRENKGKRQKYPNGHLPLSDSRACEGGRDEWLRIYERMVAMLRKSQKHVEALAADRARLEAVIKIQHQFWVARDGVLQGRLHEARRMEACRRRCDAAKLKLLLGDKEREVRRYQMHAELQDDDLEDFRTCAVALAAENTKLKIKLKEVESPAELSKNTTDHEHSARNLRVEIRELKKAYKTLISKKEKEVSALLAEKDFVWNQFKTMEKDYNSLLKKKKWRQHKLLKLHKSFSRTWRSCNWLPKRRRMKLADCKKKLMVPKRRY